MSMKNDPNLATQRPVKTSAPFNDDYGERGLVPPVYLPDGQEFRTWSPDLQFSCTFYVDQGHPHASDNNPGTPELPFLTVGRAAEVLQPGERVVVAAGVYREHVTPARGGSGPDSIISYEAAPGAEVVIKGSEPLGSDWTLAKGWQGIGDGTGTKVWCMPLLAEWFAGYNPFAIANLPRLGAQDCFTPSPHLLPTLTARRGLVFQDGRPLRQVSKPSDLTEADGTYWVEWNGQALYVRPRGDVEMNTALFEITTREQAFAPSVYELGYIRVRGFTIEQVADGFPWPQRAALSTMRGHHWIIEENTIRWSNALGLDIGRSETDMEVPELCGYHIVRRNRVHDCGICGIAGTGPLKATLIEENVIYRCGWHNVEDYFECAGIKTHHNHDCLLRRNVLMDMTHAAGIWMDFGNINSRCSQNVVINTDSRHGGIFMEASQAPNLVDCNIIWGSTGDGIYQHDCDELTIAHNLICYAQKNGIRMRANQGRIVFGREATAVDNRILNNILVGNGEPLSISDPDNACDGNLIAGTNGDFDLAGWQARTGWDIHSVVAEFAVEFDVSTRQLTWHHPDPFPFVAAVAQVVRDIIDVAMDDVQVIPGPFVNEPESHTFLLQGVPSATSLAGE